MAQQAKSLDAPDAGPHCVALGASSGLIVHSNLAAEILADARARFAALLGTRQVRQFDLEQWWVDPHID